MTKRVESAATLLIAVAALLAVAAAQQVPQGAAATMIANADVDSTSKATNSAPQFQQRNARYQICAGDVFDVSFELSPEFNQTVTVQPDGFVTLRGVGDVHVQGQNIPQLTLTLKQSYGNILNDPIISISLKEFQKPYFVADGQLGKPGKYEMHGDVTLTEAIAMAGGFTTDAKHSQVLLFRRVNDEWVQAKIFNVKQMLKEGNLHEDPQLHPGDMLVVPKNALSKIRPFLPSTGVGAYSQLYTPK